MRRGRSVAPPRAADRRRFRASRCSACSSAPGLSARRRADQRCRVPERRERERASEREPHHSARVCRARARAPLPGGSGVGGRARRTLFSSARLSPDAERVSRTVAVVQEFEQEVHRRRRVASGPQRPRELIERPRVISKEIELEDGLRVPWIESLGFSSRALGFSSRTPLSLWVWRVTSRVAPLSNGNGKP